MATEGNGFLSNISESQSFFLAKPPTRRAIYESWDKQMRANWVKDYKPIDVSAVFEDANVGDDAD